MCIYDIPIYSEAQAAQGRSVYVSRRGYVMTTLGFIVYVAYVLRYQETI